MFHPALSVDLAQLVVSELDTRVHVSDKQEASVDAVLELTA